MDLTTNDFAGADEYSSVVLKLEVDEDYKINFDYPGISQTVKVEDGDEADVKSDIATLELEHIAINKLEGGNETQSLDEGRKRKFKNEYLSDDEESEEECPRKKIKSMSNTCANSCETVSERPHKQEKISTDANQKCHQHESSSRCDYAPALVVNHVCKLTYY